MLHAALSHAPVQGLASVIRRPPRCLTTAFATHSPSMACYRIGSAPEDTSPCVDAEELIQQLLTSDPEGAVNMERVSAAARRVAELQIEQARLARALFEAENDDAASSQLRERRAMTAAENIMAGAEAKAAELRLRAAELEAESAAAARDAAAWQSNTEAERLETAKAGVAALVGGLACSLPLAAVSTTNSQISTLIGLGTAMVSSFLFGLVYRYALRMDLANVQLKGGVVAAFGLVRGFAQAVEIVTDRTEGLSQVPTVETLGEAAAAMGESVLLFAFASASLEFALQRGWVKPFMNDRSIRNID